MAIMDKRTNFGDDFSLVASLGATLLFTNQIDLGAAGEDPGNGQVVYLNMVVTEAVVGATGTLNFRLRSDDSAAIHATTSSAHIETGAIAVASLTLGAKFSFPIPVQGLAYERYLGLQAVNATAATTAGKATAWLGLDPIGTGVQQFPDATN